MAQYLIVTESSHHWLIERARDAKHALKQYYEGEAEPHQYVARMIDAYPDVAERRAHAQFLRDKGQATGGPEQI